MWYFPVYLAQKSLEVNAWLHYSAYRLSAHHVILYMPYTTAWNIYAKIYAYTKERYSELIDYWFSLKVDARV